MTGTPTSTWTLVLFGCCTVLGCWLLIVTLKFTGCWYADLKAYEIGTLTGVLNGEAPADAVKLLKADPAPWAWLGI